MHCQFKGYIAILNSDTQVSEYRYRILWHETSSNFLFAYIHIYIKIRANSFLWKQKDMQNSGFVLGSPPISSVLLPPLLPRGTKNQFDPTASLHQTDTKRWRLISFFSKKASPTLNINFLPSKFNPKTVNTGKKWKRKKKNHITWEKTDKAHVNRKHYLPLITSSLSSLPLQKVNEGKRIKSKRQREQKKEENPFLDTTVGASFNRTARLVERIPTLHHIKDTGRCRPLQPLKENLVTARFFLL